MNSKDRIDVQLELPIKGLIVAFVILCPLLFCGLLYWGSTSRKKEPPVTPIDVSQLTVTNHYDMLMKMDLSDSNRFSSAEAAMTEVFQMGPNGNFYWFTPAILNLHGATELRIGSLDGRKLAPGDVLLVDTNGVLRFDPITTVIKERFDSGKWRAE